MYAKRKTKKISWTKLRAECAEGISGDASLNQICDMPHARTALFIPHFFHSNLLFTTTKVQIISIPVK